MNSKRNFELTEIALLRLDESNYLVLALDSVRNGIPRYRVDKWNNKTGYFNSHFNMSLSEATRMFYQIVEEWSSTINRSALEGVYH